MKCEEVRDELIAYARGELDDTRKAEVEAHLAGCESCTRELEGAREVMALTQMADDASIAELAHRLIHTAIQRGASDLHLEVAGGDRPRVRQRVDGVLREEQAIPPEQYEPLIGCIKLLAKMNVSEKRVPQEGRFTISHEGREYEVRVSTVPYTRGEGMVMRMLDRSSEGVLIGLNRLGLSPRTLATLESVISQGEGLILVSGPTGSGKSTVLYSILNKLNRPEVKIVSAEDPVEYLLPGVNQLSVSVDPRSGLSFATAMRALMRQDPDIFMVGEIRDRETAEVCVKAALTGHLVLTVLHAPDAIRAVSRVRDMGVEPFAIAAAVKLVTAQRLVRRPCPECKEPYQPPAEALKALGLAPDTTSQGFVRATGCDACGGAGYRGRIGLYEVLTMNEELAHLVAEQAPEATLRAHAIETGTLWPFRSDAAAKVAEGATTIEEVERVLPGLFGATSG